MSEIQALTLRVRDLSEAVDWWNAAMIWALVLAALAAVAVVVTTRIALTRTGQLADMQSELSQARQTELEVAQRNTAEAQRQAAEAQLALKKYVDEVARRQGPRSIPDDLVVSILKSAPPKKAIMLYQDGSSETYLFAGHLRSLLQQSGWQVSELAAVASLVNIDGGTGLREVIVFMRHADRIHDESTSEGALWKALLSIKIGIGGPRDESLPEDTLRIYVGPKL